MNEISLREVTPDDAEELLKIYEYYVLSTAITFEYDVPSADEFRRRIEHTLERYPYIAAVEDGKIVGYAYAGAFVGRKAYDWSAELTVYVDHHIRKKGIGGLLYRELENILQKMGIINLYACIGYPQTDDEYLTKNSEEFHAHLGFKTVGTFTKCGYKFGRWYDMIWMEKVIGEHNPHTNDIIPFGEIEFDGTYSS